LFEWESDIVYLEVTWGHSRPVMKRKKQWLVDNVWQREVISIPQIFRLTFLKILTARIID
jgi:hypothetical protein